MIREYAVKINSLLESYHFNRYFCGLPAECSLKRLRHGLSHLYFSAISLGDLDDRSQQEFRMLLIRLHQDELPQPYNLAVSHPKNRPRLIHYSALY